MRLFMLIKFIYLWDVVFTAIDNTQQRLFWKLKGIQSEIEEKETNTDKYRGCEEYDSWNDLSESHKPLKLGNNDE